MRFRIYAFTVSVFIVFVWTEGLNALQKFAFNIFCVYNRLRVDGASVSKFFPRLMKVIETCRRYLNFQSELSFLLALHCHSHLLNCMNVEARAVCLNLNLKRKNLPILIHSQIGDTSTSQTQCELSAVIKWFLSCFRTCHVPLELS